MEKIKIKIFYENEILFECKYVILDPNASSTPRKFIFRNIKVVTNENLFKKELKSQLCPSDLKVLIRINNKKYQWSTIEEFKIHIIDYADFDTVEWWINGFVYDDHFKEYRQGVIDIFNCWENNKDINWFDLPLNSLLKKDYLYSCYLYSGLSSNIVKREIFPIDCSLLKEERDFLYLISLAFVGDKGYFGHDLYTFNDCLLEIHHQKNFFPDMKIVFSNRNKITDPNIENIYQEVKQSLLKFRFEIIELE